MVVMVLKCLRVQQLEKSPLPKGLGEVQDANRDRPIPTLASIPKSFDFREICSVFGLKNPLINTGINTRKRNCANRQQSAGPWSLSSSRFQPTSR